MSFIKYPSTLQRLDIPTIHSPPVPAIMGAMTEVPAPLTPLGEIPAVHEFATQLTSGPRTFLLPTSNGILKVCKWRPIDDLEHIFRQGILGRQSGPNPVDDGGLIPYTQREYQPLHRRHTPNVAPELAAFFARYTVPETCVMALHLACCNLAE